jgi:hypothetical protein
VLKRITKVEHDLATGYYTHWIDEKIPNRAQIWKGMEKFAYFKEW